MKRILLFTLAAFSILTLSAKQPEKGYRGFLDWSNSICRQAVWSFSAGKPVKETQLYTGVSTSHGYQFNPNIYVGAGIGLEHNKKWDSNIVPLFLDVRTDQEFGKFTPFADLRLGFNATGGGGI